MRPSRNAFLGYSYQECIAFLMLAKMDVEREIVEIEIEATVDNKFDDIKISTCNTLIYCQVKDFDNITLNDLIIEGGQVTIKGKKHKLSNGSNLIFFKNIDITPNTQFLGFHAYSISDVYIITLSREKAETIINTLYKYNEKRVSIISQFFNIRLDDRLLNIKQEELPIIDIYDIHLQEKTINVGKKILEFEDILFVEGKPGVGKSHLVTCLAKEFENCLVYRFWVSNQDRDYNARLFFQNFLSNISKELFQDYRYRTEDEIIEYLNKNKKTVIIDGLDHVENHQKTEINSFINFINKLKSKCKTIVLSRPLKSKIDWAKQQLVNWNFEETRKVLNKLYHISDYHTCRNIFDVTDGYPILVRFVTEHFILYNEIPLSWKLNDINKYYDKIISNSDILSALSIFIASRSFIMESEISLFLEDDHSEIVKEFIKSNPYLFEIRLNRISLFHDSLNTFLRKKKIGNSQRNSKVKQIVHESLISGEKRFMSRFAFFDLDKSMKLEIIKKYVSINYFQQLIKSCIDFEALRVFYKQIRESLTEFDANKLEIINYYDLSLIINITERDHISTVNEFLYTYVKCILYNGYRDDDITSSEHLFCMYYYYKTNDATLLYNLTSDSHYDTERFYQRLNYDVGMEENYFFRHKKSFRKTKQLRRFLNQEIIFESYEYLPHILANLYLHETKISELKQIQIAIKTYLDIDENLGDFALKQAMAKFKNLNGYLSQTYLIKAKDIISSLGKEIFQNEYHNNSLKELILLNCPNGSLSVWPKVLNYIRLSLFEKRKIDLASVGCFFAMYNNRKDVTVISIDEALKTFENKGLISINKSIDIIVFTQSMSEKGIRHLLSSYIQLHSPRIISSVLKKFKPDQLQIIWFDLPMEFINHFPDHLFDYGMYSQLLRWNSHTKEVDFKDIQNVFYSKRKLILIETLNFLKYRIKISADHPSLNELQKLDCLLSMNVSDKETEYFKTSEERYTQGILDSDSVDFIKEKKLKVEDIAGYTNGYYSVFAELDIFKAYDKEHIKQNASLIVHNALIGRIQSINMFASLYYFPGNFPKFVNDYEVEINFKDLYVSFITFLKISLLNNKLKYDSKNHIS
jgi:hypothetical protein